MKNTTNKHNSEVRAEPATNPPYEAIYLGADLHKQTIVVTRIIDGATPQPAQRFTWLDFWRFVEKQQPLAHKVYVVYEAGAFGFGPVRRLAQMGIQGYVIHPEKLDPRQRRVQTDKTDSRHLADKLQRYVRGNTKAMTVVYVPTETEEQARLLARHRQHLCQQLRRVQARGRGLLLSQGVFMTTHWWLEANWGRLPKLTPTFRAILEDLRQSIAHYQAQLAVCEKQLVATAPKTLPVGFGARTFVLLLAELCNYQRFPSRRQVAGFTGLCGGVSSSGPYHVDLSINKAGSPRIRGLLIELAWRMIYYQPKYQGLRTWQRLGAGAAGARRRKIALVALARQLMVDIWRWQTGRVTAQELGWEMLAP